MKISQPCQVQRPIPAQERRPAQDTGARGDVFKRNEFNKVPFDSLGAILGVLTAVGVAGTLSYTGHSEGDAAHVVGSVAGFLGGCAFGGVAGVAWDKVNKAEYAGPDLGLMMLGSIGGIAAANMAVGNSVLSTCVAAVGGLSVAAATIGMSLPHVRKYE